MVLDIVYMESHQTSWHTMFLGGGGAGVGVRLTVQFKSLETHSELATDLRWVGCQSNPYLDQHSVLILSELAADPIWVGCQLTPQGSTLCRSSLSWLQILSELAVDWPPGSTLCRSSLSWLQILSELAVNQTPPGSTLCRSSLSWLQILSELAANWPPPGSTLCGSSLSWLWILSELAVDWPPRINTADPLWVGCQLNPPNNTLLPDIPCEARFGH